MEGDTSSRCLSLPWGPGSTVGVEEVVEHGRTHILVLVLGGWDEVT